MRCFTPVVILISISMCSQFLLAQQAEAENESIPDRGTIQFNYESFHLRNKKLFLVREVPDKSAEKKNVEETFMVAIPYVEDGVTKTRLEQRTRTMAIYPMKKTLIHVGPEFDLKNVAGEKVDSEKLIFEMKSNTLRVVTIHEGQDDIPEHLKEFLNPKTIIARIPPSRQDEKE